MFLKLAKGNYYNQYSHNIKQIIFNHDQFLSEPQYKYVDQVKPQLNNFNVPCQSETKPSF